MVKNKKRSFLSWLGLSQENKKQKDLKPSIEITEHKTIPIPEELVDNRESLPITFINTCKKSDESQFVECMLQNSPEVDQKLMQSKLIATLDTKSALIKPENVASLSASSMHSLISVKPESSEITHNKDIKKSLFIRLKHNLIKTKQNLGSGLLNLFRGKKIDDNLFERLEEQLLISDVGVETTRKILNALIYHSSRKQLKDAEALYGQLKIEMSKILTNTYHPLNVNSKIPYIILMVGVNGSGKTTTIGKLAHKFQSEGKSVMLAAGDTFRAAAVEQLQVWGQKNRILVVAQSIGADSASVIFDAIHSARARNIDVLIADTAGRLQNKLYLMEELKKIIRVMKKLDTQMPHEIILTLDASTGQNALSQVKLFNKTVGLTGIIVTKLDGTAKGGLIFAIADQFKIPICYIGIGEDIEDLRLFKANDFIEALFD